MNIVIEGSMRPWMKILVSLVLLIISFNIFAECTFKSEVKKVVSLSATVAVALDEIGLLNHPVVQGVSIFSPISKQKFTKKIYPGGLYLAPGTVKEFNQSVVFYDQGRELKNLLQSLDSATLVEIQTRNQLPLETIEIVINKLKQFTTNCEKQFFRFKEKAISLQSNLLKKIPQNFPVVFYLGEFQNERPPELVIVHDGAVKLLIREKNILTYASELSYVNWSSKIMTKMPARTIHLGIKDSGMSGEKKITQNSKHTNLVYPGALVPGITQIEAFLFWANSL
jgi:hypothetical protein